MHVVVCIKQVPDSWAEKTLDPDTLRLDRASADRVMNELDEHAVEAALTLAEQTDGTVTVVSAGPAEAPETIRKALAMGAHEAVHVFDEALAGADALGTSAALAAAIGTLNADVVLFGAESTDARMGVIPAMVAERLNLPQLTQATTLEVAEGTATITRSDDAGDLTLQAPLPAVISVVESLNEPRYPNFKGIMAAKKKPIAEKSLEDLGLSPEQVAPTSQVLSYTARPARTAGTIITDEAQAVDAVMTYLTEQHLV